MAAAQEERSPSLDDCLKLLKGERDEQRLAGLLLVTKFCKNDDIVSLKKVYEAVGTHFLDRLLRTGKQNPELLIFVSVFTNTNFGVSTKCEFFVELLKFAALTGFDIFVWQVLAVAMELTIVMCICSYLLLFLLHSAVFQR